MAIYLLIILYLFLFRNNKDKLSFYLGLFILFIVSAFRGLSVGVDTENYLAEYKQFIIMGSNQLSFKITDEPLFQLFFYACAKLGLSFRSVLVIEVIIFLTPIAFVLLKKSPYPTESLLICFLLGLYFIEFNATRQAVAFSFVLLSIYHLNERHYWRFLIAILMAVGFHVSSIIAIPIIVLPFITLNNVWSIVLLVGSFIIPQVIDLTSYLISAVESVSNTEALGALVDYKYYLSSDYDVLSRLPIFPSLRTLLFIYVLFDYKKTERSNDLFYDVSFIYVTLHNLMTNTPSFVGRIVYFYEIALIIFLVRWGRRGIWQTLAVYFYVLLYFLNFYIVLNTEGVKPYEFGY